MSHSAAPLQSPGYSFPREAEAAREVTAGESSIVARRRLRVLVFTSVFPNPRQPLHGTFVFERTHHLANLADIRVVAPIAWYRALNGGPDAGGAGGALSVVHPKFWYPPKMLPVVRGVLMALSVFPHVRRLRGEFDFDLIDAHFAYPDGFAAVLLGRWFRRPVCITLRGTEILQSRTRSGRRLCDWAINRAERIIAVAKTLAERAREAGIPAARITTIPNGVDGARFHPIDRGEARRAIGLAEACRVLIGVGHISPRKGFQRVIRALPRVLEAIPNVRFVIVGGRGAEADNSADLRALVGALGLADRVLFAGPEPPDRVALWLGAADVFVHASDFEGCPNVVMEAMACGRPVVATKVGDVERMVPSFAGLLLDNSDDDGALADALIVALRREWDSGKIAGFASERSWEVVAREVQSQWELAVRLFAHDALPG
ncbi:MAG: glycosyltransferase [Acetobacteraceae bacterium]